MKNRKYVRCSNKTDEELAAIGLKPSDVNIRKWNIFDELEDQESIDIFLDEAFKTNDEKFIALALEVADQARQNLAKNENAALVDKKIINTSPESSLLTTSLLDVLPALKYYGLKLAPVATAQQ